jgi:hypothetical protein
MTTAQEVELLNRATEIQLKGVEDLRWIRDHCREPEAADPDSELAKEITRRFESYDASVRQVMEYLQMLQDDRCIQ